MKQSVRFIASRTLQHEELTTRKVTTSWLLVLRSDQGFFLLAGVSPFPTRRGARSSKCSSLWGGPPPWGSPRPVEQEVLLILGVGRQLLGFFWLSWGGLQEGWKLPRGGGGEGRRWAGSRRSGAGTGRRRAPQTPGGWQHLCPVGVGLPLLRRGHLPVWACPVADALGRSPRASCFA